MMRKLLRFLSCLTLIFLLNACSSGNWAPVSELNWQPFSRYKTQHVVRKGETLFAIAFRYDTDYRSLARLNHLNPPYSLRVGQVLNVQVGTRTRTKAQRAYYASHSQKPRTPVRAKPIYSPGARVRSSSGWLWPVSGRVATTFIPDQGKKGINIACAKGEKVHAAASGVVAYAGSGLSGYGNLIIIKHNHEYLTAYGNNARNLVVEGQRVSAGQAIAEVGVIDHKYIGVHFEIRKAGKPVNPLIYLQKG